MQTNPQVAELNTIFTQLDKQKAGFLTLDQFKAYLDTQPRKIPQYMLAQLFNLFPESKMSQKAFATYIMGYRMNLEQFAISRFAMEKELSKHASASPPGAANQIKKSCIKFSVASKKNLSGGQKHRLSITLGKNNVQQAKKYQQLSQILGRKPQQIVAIIKFRVQQEHEEIRSGLQKVLQTARGILSQLDQSVSRIIDLFKFSIKAHNGFIYIIIQVGHVFLLDTAQFINEIIQTLSPEAHVQFNTLFESNYLKDFLKQGSQKKMQDLQAQLNLQIDSESLKKLKSITYTQTQHNLQSDAPLKLLLLLFEQVTLSAQFANSQKLFNQLGIANTLTDTKSMLGSLKEMSLLETAEGFIPEAGAVIQGLRKYGKGEGEVSVNLINCFVRLEFLVEVEGIFDLL